MSESFTDNNCMLSGSRYLFIHLPTDGMLLQSVSSTHRAQYDPGCKFSHPESSQSYHFSGLREDTNTSMLYCVLSTPSLLMLFIRSMTCVLLIAFIFLYFFWLIEERIRNSSQFWLHFTYILYLLLDCIYHYADNKYPAHFKNRRI